jgi:hypothetical protein
MAGWAWGGLVIGLAIVALAVGIPYFFTHKRMRSPHDVSDSRGYLRARRRSWPRRRLSTAPRPEETDSPRIS